MNAQRAATWHGGPPGSASQDIEGEGEGLAGLGESSHLRVGSRSVPEDLSLLGAVRGSGRATPTPKASLGTEGVIHCSETRMDAPSARDLLLHSGRVVTPGRSDATAVLISDGRIVAVGGDELGSAVGVGVARVDLGGRLVTPAFVDAHVHSVQTGLLEVGLDLHGCRSREQVLDAVAARLAAGGGAVQVLFGQGWDERAWPDPRPPTRAELDRAGGASVPVYLARVDVHSAVVSSASGRPDPRAVG